MSEDSTRDPYNDRVAELVAMYESVTFEGVHECILDLVPASPAIVLDVGAGSGRDAAWFARRGCDVVAVEPAALMLSEGRRLHAEPQIQWLQDSLPGLEKTIRLGLAFDFILLSAVWMHVAPKDRQRSFRKLASLLKSGGLLIISLRYGPAGRGRSFYPVTSEEIQQLAWQHGMAVRRVSKSPDRMGRPDVTWETLCLQLPDDGTEALPLLRHTILNDSKSSTYKLALLRILVRIADSALGIAVDAGDEFVSIPLGLVALYWLRMYKPLVEADIPQRPPDRYQRGLGFVGEAFSRLRGVSPYDLRVGARFAGEVAYVLRQALIDVRDTIRDMPAHHITYPNSSVEIFKATSTGRVPKLPELVLNQHFLWSLGELRIPRHIWQSMSRFASWIEPALLNEWVRLMQMYAGSQQHNPTYDELLRALTWLEPERDTSFVRTITQRFLEKGEPVYCVWSGKQLHERGCDIDHCFPFSAWPCGDLWNLMPADRNVNQHQKKGKLVSANTLQRAKDRMCDWWERAYIRNDSTQVQTRFLSEAGSALPVDGLLSAGGSVERIFDGVLLRRAALKRDLQLADW